MPLMPRRDHCSSVAAPAKIGCSFKSKGWKLDLDGEAVMGEILILNRLLDPLYGDYIELNDLDEPLELRRNQVDDLKPTYIVGRRRSLDPLYGDYIKLNDLDEPLELRRNQIDDLKPTIEEGEVVDIPMFEEVKTRNDDNMLWKIWMLTEMKEWEKLLLENHYEKLRMWKQEDLME
ncbi:hypothetical protein Tco_1243379 [Tanacetum coccineum]